MYFFDATNSVAVCLYVGIAQFISGCFLLVDYVMEGRGGLAFTVYCVEAFINAALWILASKQFWRNKRDKIFVFGAFVGVTALLTIVDRCICTVGDYFAVETTWPEYAAFAVGLLFCLYMLRVSGSIRRKSVKRIEHQRKILIVVIAMIAVSRLVQLPLMEFSIADYIDTMTSMILFFYIFISLYDEGIIEGMSANAKHLKKSEEEAKS